MHRHCNKPHNTHVNAHLALLASLMISKNGNIWLQHTSLCCIQILSGHLWTSLTLVWGQETKTKQIIISILQPTPQTDHNVRFSSLFLLKDICTPILKILYLIEIRTLNYGQSHWPQIQKATLFFSVVPWTKLLTGSYWIS